MNQTETVRIRKIDAAFLFAASITDLLFGILATFVFDGLVWQLSSLFASILTLLIIVKMLVGFREKSDISGLVISVIDVACGVLAVVIAAHVAYIIATVGTGALALKAAKIFVQSDKLLKLSKNGARKIIKYLAVIPAAVYNGKRKRSKIKMSKNEIKNTFTAYGVWLKNNPISLCALIVEITIGVILGGVGTFAQIYFSAPLPLWAEIAIGIAIAIALIALPIFGIACPGFESPAKITIRKIGEMMGFESLATLSTDGNEKWLSAMDTKYRNEYITAVTEDGYEGTLRDYVLYLIHKGALNDGKVTAEEAETEKVDPAAEEAALKAKWQAGIKDGTITVSYADYKAGLSATTDTESDDPAAEEAKETVTAGVSALNKLLHK